MAESSLYVRVKPYNPKKGHLTRRHFDGTYGHKFLEGKGWYEVSAEEGRHLRRTLQNAYDPDSPEVFDVCTLAQARELEAEERIKKESVAASPDAPNRLVSREQREKTKRDAALSAVRQTELDDEVVQQVQVRRPVRTIAGEALRESTQAAAKSMLGRAERRGLKAETVPYGDDEDEEGTEAEVSDEDKEAADDAAFEAALAEAADSEAAAPTQPRVVSLDAKAEAAKSGSGPGRRGGRPPKAATPK